MDDSVAPGGKLLPAQWGVLLLALPRVGVAHPVYVSSKTYTLLTPLGILLEYWSYAFNNGLMSQGDLA